MSAEELIKLATSRLSEATACAAMDKPAIAAGYVNWAIEALQAALAELKAKQAKP